ncbi:MAG: hypothetical protein GX442_22560 [Candidatus Riflebacteria bacterium]|nr:hypothetical protein [Candidatus Riflebacteria bacterium]
MAKKSGMVYVCQSCGQSFPKWQGNCSACGEWNTLAQEPVAGVATGPTGGITFRSGRDDRNHVACCPEPLARNLASRSGKFLAETPAGHT